MVYVWVSLEVVLGLGQSTIDHSVTNLASSIAAINRVFKGANVGASCSSPLSGPSSKISALQAGRFILGK